MQTLKNTEQYRRCLVLAGGGFRFGCYLGVHAAAVDCGRAPDLLLASCGGAIAAAVIAGLPDAQARRDWLASPEMYAYLRGIAPVPDMSLVRVLGGAARRWLARAAAPRAADLFRDHLFALPPSMPLPLPLPAAAAGCPPALAIVGGQLLYRADAVGSARGTRRLFAQVLFCPERAAALLEGMPAPAADPRWSDGAIASDLRVECAMPLADAVRVSIADMFYFPVHAWAGRAYTGGVLDLFPIELAQRLAREVLMERKMPFNRWLALPALRTVFGIDGAARLRHVHAQRADAWFDTRDAAHALRGFGIGKRIFWRRQRIELAVPDKHAAYAAHVRAQWEYGYRKGMLAFGGRDA